MHLVAWGYNFKGSATKAECLYIFFFSRMICSYDIDDLIVRGIKTPSICGSSTLLWNCLNKKHILADWFCLCSHCCVHCLQLSSSSVLSRIKTSLHSPNPAQGWMNAFLNTQDALFHFPHFTPRFWLLFASYVWFSFSWSQKNICFFCTPFPSSASSV